MDDNISIGIVYSIDDNILSISYMGSNRQTCYNKAIMEEVSVFAVPPGRREMHAGIKGTAKSC